MLPHLAVFEFNGSGLFVRGEALGATWTFVHGGMEILVCVPQARSAVDGTLSDSSGRDTGVRVTIRKDDVPIAASIQRLMIIVFTEVRGSGSNPDAVDTADAQRALEEAMGVAFDVAAAVLRGVRVRGEQAWMPPSYVPPELQDASLIDGRTGRRVPNVGDNRPVILYGSAEDAAASRATLDAVLQDVIEGRGVPEAALLLHDARETLSGRGAERETPLSNRDTRRAVLLAAIASEVALGDVMREKTSAARRDAIELLVDRFRPIAQLPHKPMKAAVDRSLREDDKTLYDDVDRLFQLRNRVAHRGYEPKLEEARTAVDTATRLARWLDAVPELPGH